MQRDILSNALLPRSEVGQAFSLFVGIGILATRKCLEEKKKVDAGNP